MAHKNIYKRKNHDPNLIPELVEDPEKLLRKKKIQVDAGIPLINRSISFPKEGFISVEYLEFDEEFEQSLFISKSDSYLNQIVFDLERFHTFIASKSSSFSKEEKEEFWNSLNTTLKE